VTPASPLVAVLDANVLYSAAMRDFFMRLTSRFVFQPKWTDAIHEEWMEAVLRNRPDISRVVLERTRDLMNQYGNDWQVPAYEQLIDSLSLPDPDDRHVLAAAITSGSSLIVTSNISDFPVGALSPYAIRAVRPDAFACEMLALKTKPFLRAVREHRASLKNPPKTVPEYLDSLTVCGLAQTAILLAEYEDVI